MTNKELSLKEIQQASYGVLKQVSKIFDEHGWRWFLTYGTLIGALRHRGIIPWDDDIDIMMPRPDYEEMKRYFTKYANELKPLKLFDKSTVDDYPHMISRISNQEYHLIFDNEKDYDIGAFIDVYPLDGVGNDIDDAIRITKKTKKLASLCFLTSRKKFGVDNTESIIKMIIKYPAFLWARIQGNTYYINRLNDYGHRFSYDQSNYVACVVWPAGKKYGRERDVFNRELFETQMAEFEDGEYPIPVGYNEFLSITYGDYMTPPSEAGKKTHHTYKAYRR